MIEKMWNRFDSKKNNISPTRIVLLNFVFIIIVGTLFLLLPISSIDQKSTSFIVAFFTSVSSVCVTGMSVVPTYSYWSIFGKIVIIILVQIGGIGLTTFLVGVLSNLGGKPSLHDKVVIGHIYNKENINNTTSLVKFTVIFVLLLEGVFAVILSIYFYKYNNFSFAKSIGYGIFHSISAFCNAGIDILGDSSLTKYVGDIGFNLIFIFTIFISGLGFKVWFDIINNFKKLKETNSLSVKSFFGKLSLYSKIAICTSLFLIFIGSFLFFVFEYNYSFANNNFTLKEKILSSIFQSVSVRTAGFYTIDLKELSGVSKFIMVILMLIGGSPGGTSGGIKTITIFILTLSLISTMREKKSIKVFGSTISGKIIIKSSAIFGIYIFILIIGVLILSFTEKNNVHFTNIVIEVSAALSTTGLAMGITKDLSTGGKLLIIICMILGRIGPIDVISGFLNIINIENYKQ